MHLPERRNGRSPALAAEFRPRRLVSATVGGWNLDEVVGEVRHPLISRSLFGRDLLRLYGATYALSEAQQYAQPYDMFTLAALIRQWQRQGRIRVDWELVLAPYVDAEVAGWSLPGGHTGAPQRTAGQTGGVYRAWWALFVRMIRYHFFGIPLPHDAEVKNLLPRFGVRRYATTSSTFPEVSGIRVGLTELRNGEWADAAPADMASRAVEPHLAGAMWWLMHRRPRRGPAGQAALDRHELQLRTIILEAEARPVVDRTLCDEYVLLLQAAFDDLLANPVGEEREQLAELYWDVVAAHNTHHPDTPIVYLHR